MPQRGPARIAPVLFPRHIGFSFIRQRERCSTDSA
ncbi:hypothetical protein chiPu_0033505, partial [Chiloscyllium punctatum]|nr:hypothetical protein [Chiloscyllium punctatum]